MHALFVTTHHIPHCLALTLSRSTCSHTVSLYRVLTLSHVRFRTSCHMVSSSVNVSHRLVLFPIHLTVCRVTGQFDTEPRTVRRTIQRTGNAHCCYSNCYCAHTLLCRPLLHYCCTIQHTAHHTNPEGRQDNRGQGHARGQDNVRTVLGHVLTLSYIIKRSHDKLKRGKNV